MPKAAPFRGIRFNPARAGDPADLITPPFDVINRKQQEAFYRRSPYNMVRLSLGKKTDYDTRTHNPHTRAARTLRRWLKDGVLQADPEPSFYLTSIEFVWGGETRLRLGLIARVRLSSFAEGQIRPHERTFTNVKSERLALMKQCHANFDPIFSLYPSSGGLRGELEAFAAANAPQMDFIDRDAVRHRLWRIINPAEQARIAESLAAGPFYIADGHHRYETALNYRRWLREQAPLPPDHPANSVMMYLTDIEDPGLVIRPAHRLIRQVSNAQLAGMLDRAHQYFEVEVIRFKENERQTAIGKFEHKLRHRSGRPVLGMYYRGERAFFVLRLTAADALKARYGDELPPALRNLDVTVLTYLVFIDLLGFDQQWLDNEQRIGYEIETREAVEAVHRGDYSAAFLLNPTGVQQVCDIADQGLVMPRKATYFYPKVSSGLVIHRLQE